MNDEKHNCTGRLQVTIFAYPDAQGNEPFDEQWELLPEVEITLISESNAIPVQVRRGGETEWTDLPAGSYSLQITRPEGYGGIYFWIDGEQKPHSSAAQVHIDRIEIKENEETEVEIGFAPLPATIAVTAIIADYRGCQAGQVANVEVEIFSGQQQIACFVADGRPQTINRPGPLTIRAAPSVRHNGQRLRLSSNASQFLQIESGGSYQTSFSYAASLAEVIVSACLQSEADGKTQTIPLSGTRFALYRGNAANGTPIQQKTQFDQAIVFSDLEAGAYTLAAKAPVTYQGQAIEAESSGDSIFSFVLGEGQQMSLTDQFCYQFCTGQVRVTVLDAGCHETLDDVPLTLRRTDGSGISWKATSYDGEAVFRNVAPGNYRVTLEQEKVTLPDGTKWELSDDSRAQQSITVMASSTPVAHILRLVQDIHRISGLVTVNEQPIPFAVIEVQDESFNHVDTLTADQSGKYEYMADRAGTYYLVAQHTAGGVPSQRFRVSVNQPTNANLALMTTSGAAPAENAFNHLGQSIGNAFGSITDFPLLTQDVGSTPAARSAAPSGTGGSSLGQMTEKALRDVLGWKPRADDPKGFAGALKQSFSCREVSGYTECTWTPRTYAVQTDLSGGITGAQASLYKRAQDAIDKALPLLDGLYALRLDSDAQDVEALKAVLRSQMQELVMELGYSGGPRIARVDQLFFLLLGGALIPAPGTPVETEPDRIAGQFGSLRDEFGLWSVAPPAGQSILVNTVDEEQNLTNFRILSDYLTSLRQSWITNRSFFTGTRTQPFFGTQLVLLSRTLSVVAESVEEVRFTLDSVFIGQAERQTLELQFPANVQIPFAPCDSSGAGSNNQTTGICNAATGADRMFVEDLLSWVQSFSAEEGPRLIQDGGKYGVQFSFLPVVVQLRNLMLGAITPVNSTSLPTGYQTGRVHRALNELAAQLHELALLAAPITHPIPAQ
jgi:hypothetical protein